MGQLDSEKQQVTAFQPVSVHQSPLQERPISEKVQQHSSANPNRTSYFGQNINSRINNLRQNWSRTISNLKHEFSQTLNQFEYNPFPSTRRQTPFRSTSGQQPLIGIIDTSFEPQSHGRRMLEAISHINSTAPKWLGQGVGTGNWADSLVQFVDTAKAGGHKQAIANLSFDLTQIERDGSITTRTQLTPAEYKALAYAHQNGVLVVASAGNHGGALSALGQASKNFNNILVVGATEGQTKADYSGFGQGLSVVAPGSQPGLPTTGTSLSTAQVTGALSKVWAANPNLNVRQVIQVLKSTATDLYKPGWDYKTGFGALNAGKAVSLAKHITPESSFSRVLDRANLSPSSSLWQSRNGARASERSNAAQVAVLGGGIPLLPLIAGTAAVLGAVIAYKTYQERRDRTSSAPATVRPKPRSEAPSVPRPDTRSSAPPGVRPATRPDTRATPQTGVRSPARPRADRPSAPARSAVRTVTRLTAQELIKPTNVAHAPGLRAVHTIQSGNTLWETAQAAFGSGTRWRELVKADGSGFSEREVRRLQPGTPVFTRDRRSSARQANKPISSNRPAQMTATEPAAPKVTTFPEAPARPISTSLPQAPAKPSITTFPAHPQQPSITTFPAHPQQPSITTFPAHPRQPSIVASQPLSGRSTTQRFRLEEIDELMAAPGSRSTTSLDLSDPSISVRIPPRSTEVLRRQPGVATGGENLPDVTGRWLLDGRVGLVPGQIARKMQGMDFKNFHQFRNVFWKLVAQDPDLSQGWSQTNLDRMREGKAPFAETTGQVGGEKVYQLDHSHDLRYDGGTYDLDNIRIVTPRFHDQYGG